MKYKRMPIEIESPEELGYDSIECNLAESSVNDMIFKDIKLDLNGLILCYGSHKGKTELRELIASEHKGINADDVIVTAGAASGLFIIATSLLDSEDHMIVVRPNYASNIETPRAIGCEISFIDLKFEEQFVLDPKEISKQIKKNTKLISITTPHNPTGTMISETALVEMINIAEKYNCFLLVDETYRDLSFIRTPPLAASLSDKVISVSSVSKAFGLPGIRIGWLITKNKELKELFIAAKEQIFLCNSVIDEEVAYQFLLQKNHFLKPVKYKTDQHLQILENWMTDNEYLEWVKPEGGVICFPRIRSDIKIDLTRFYTTLYGKYKTLVGPGHWFEMDQRYMRIGYGWPDTPSLKKGLKNVLISIRENQI